MKSLYFLLSLLLFDVVTGVRSKTNNPLFNPPNAAANPLAICEVGSNSIRFGLLKEVNRGLPFIYRERAPISLLDAQQQPHSDASSSPSGIHTPSTSVFVTAYRRFLHVILSRFRAVPDNVADNVPDDVLNDVDVSVRRFAEIAKHNNAELQIVATEATRAASNSEAIVERIENATGKTVNILSKAEESRLGALGVQATFWNPCGYVMDLGGGSLELNYLKEGITDDNAQSIPLGAGVVRERLALKAGVTVRAEILQAIKDAKANLAGSQTCEGKTLYLGGGGFKAIGHMAMSDTKHPIRTINGFTISAMELRTICTRYAAMSQSDLAINLGEVNNIRDERQEQMPANLLITLAALDALEPVDVSFTEGGVQHGLALSIMPPDVGQQDPLAASADWYANQMGAVQDPEKAALKSDHVSVKDNKIPRRLVDAAIRLADIGDAFNDDERSSGVFHLILRAPLLGITHQERAMLLLILNARYGGIVADEDDKLFKKIRKLAGGKEIIPICQLIGENLRNMKSNPTGAPNVLQPVLKAMPRKEVVSLALISKNYAKKIGGEEAEVTAAETKALVKWCSTAFPDVYAQKSKIPRRFVDAAIQLVHLGDAFHPDARSGAVFHLIMNGPFEAQDRPLLMLILINVYGGDVDDEDNKRFKKIRKQAGGKEIAKECKRIGKMLRLAMEVNPTDALENGAVVLKRKSDSELEVVDTSSKSTMVNVPYIQRRVEKMAKHFSNDYSIALVKEKLGWSDYIKKLAYIV